MISVKGHYTVVKSCWERPRKLGLLSTKRIETVSLLSPATEQVVTLTTETVSSQRCTGKAKGNNHTLQQGKPKQFLQTGHDQVSQEGVQSPSLTIFNIHLDKFLKQPQLTLKIILL